MSDKKETDFRRYHSGLLRGIFWIQMMTSFLWLAELGKFKDVSVWWALAPTVFLVSFYVASFLVIFVVGFSVGLSRALKKRI